MILDKIEINVEKSGEFESTEFRIDERYKNKVLWMLINRNPDRAIKIQLPTKLEPTFIVRDFGVGMDEIRIKTIFTSFGASTKNADNSQTGGFGIGAKSPLAYTDSFNIKTYINGQYWLYVIAKTKEGGIGINLLGSGETTEENGTEVQIPVNSQDTERFVESACRCTMFWKVQPIFNLCEETLYKVQDGTEIASNLRVFTEENLSGLFNNKIIVLVDGIPYEIDDKTTRDIEAFRKIKDLLRWRNHVVITLNTGDIDLLQTRESIDDTEKTASQLAKIALESFVCLEIYIDSCFTEKSLEGRITQYQDVCEKFDRIGRHTFETFSLFNNSFNIKDLAVIEYNYQSKNYSHRKLTKPQRHSGIGGSFKKSDLNKFYWDDLKENESDTLKNRRMRNHLETTGENVIVINKGNASNFVFIRTLRLLKAKKLSNLELPVKKKAVRGAKKVQVVDHIDVHELTCYGYYGSVSKNVRTIALKDLKQKYIYVGYSDHKYNTFIDSPRWNYLFREELKYKVCRISQTNMKVIKDNKNFIHISEFMATFVPTKKMIDSVVYDGLDTKNKLAKVIVCSEKKIYDKLLTKLAKCVRVEVEDITLPRDLVRQISQDNENLIKNKTRIVKMFKKRIAEKYPMLSEDNKRKENVNYINSKRRV